MTAVLAAADDGDRLPWEYQWMLGVLQSEALARIARLHAAEEQDRRDWIEGIRRRLGLVSEVHEYYVRQIGVDYWAWRCLRHGCRENGLMPGCWQCGPSKAAVAKKARAHVQRFVPAPLEREPGAGLDLTGFPNL